MYQRKTKDEYVLLGNYGYGYDEILTEESREEIRKQYKTYVENDPKTSYKIVKHRIKL